MNSSSDSRTSPSASSGWLGRIELGVAVLATLTAVCFHWLFLQHAGGLWRDEAGFVQLATLPSWSELWPMLAHDHCPLLMPAVVRGWCAVSGATDGGLRILGFCVGLFSLGSFWLASGVMRGGFPLVSLALVAVNAVAIRYGDSLRGYGLGSGLNVLMLALVWRAARSTNRLNLTLAALAAVLCVQALYQNAVFVLAACSGGMAICLADHRRRDALGISVIGFAAALSLVPYLAPMLQAQEWWVVSKTGFDAAQCWRNLAIAAGSSFPGAVWLWLMLGGLALGMAGGKIMAGPVDRLALFSVVALAVGIVGFIAFIWVSELPTQSWYYLPLLFFTAVCLDAILTGSRHWLQPMLAGLAVLAVALACVRAVPALQCRQTNMDLVAARLAAEAGPEDCIIVHPWYYGVGLGRYYQGKASWTTLPPLEDYRFYRYDLLKEKLQQERPNQAVYDRLVATLKAGHRVWVVGDLDASPAALREPNPAPNNPWGWLDAPYVSIWGAQAGYFINANARQVTVLPPVTSDGVNADENPPVTVATGWKE